MNDILVYGNIVISKKKVSYFTVVSYQVFSLSLWSKLSNMDWYNKCFDIRLIIARCNPRGPILGGITKGMFLRY